MSESAHLIPSVSLRKEGLTFVPNKKEHLIPMQKSKANQMVPSILPEN
jgi:hypothetical protein